MNWTQAAVKCICNPEIVSKIGMPESEQGIPDWSPTISSVDGYPFQAVGTLASNTGYSALEEQKAMGKSNGQMDLSIRNQNDMTSPDYLVGIPRKYARNSA